MISIIALKNSMQVFITRENDNLIVAFLGNFGELYR